MLALLSACLLCISFVRPRNRLRAVSEVALRCAGCLVIAGLTTYFLFPETSGIPVEVTHTVFKDHWFWLKAYPEILQVRCTQHSLTTYLRGYNTCKEPVTGWLYQAA